MVSMKACRQVKYANEAVNKIETPDNILETESESHMEMFIGQ